MHFATVFILGAAIVSTSASLVARQSPPSCLPNCTEQAPLGGCTISDLRCLCENPAFVAYSTECVYATCGSEIQAALTYSRSLCEGVGVTLTATSFSTVPSSSPTSSASSNGSASPTSSASSKGSASSASSSGSAPATSSKAAAVAHSANTFIGLGAVLGLVALTL